MEYNCPKQKTQRIKNLTYTLQREAINKEMSYNEAKLQQQSYKEEHKFPKGIILANIMH